MSAILGVVATIEAKAEDADTVAATLAELATQTRAEPGCIMYEVHRELEVPARFVIFERWSDEAALAAHMKAPEFGAFMKKVGASLAGRPTITKLAPVGV